jgi:hypothetical protein
VLGKVLGNMLELYDQLSRYSEVVWFCVFCEAKTRKGTRMLLCCTWEKG